jgi:hypothetical protein
MRIRRLLRAVTVCLSVFMLSSGCTTADKSNWKVLQEDAYHNKFSYDTGSVERTSTQTIKVWASSSGARYLYEIDCRSKKMRILEDHGVDQNRWIDIMSNSGDQLLYNEVCP